MKKFCIVGLMGACMACSALQVDLARINGYFTFPGGEFNVAAVNQTDPLFVQMLSHYSASTIVASPYGGVGFETFCNNGSTGLQNSPQNGTLSLNNISQGASWLYWQFALGTLAGYNYTPGTGRDASAYALQNAIWYFDGTGGADLSLTAPGVAAFIALGNANGGTNAGSTHGVEELDLTYNGVAAQPMLAIVTPDGGSTIILLGMALTGVGVFTRRFFRA